jgi:hypothetical protein
MESKNLISYLLEIGYEKFDYSPDKGYYKSNKKGDYSSMGKIADYFIKDNDFQNVIIWGLHEAGKPPTLIYPRPNIKVIKNGKRHFDEEDDCMNICLQKETAEDIYKAMFDKNTWFKYEINS